MTRKDTIELGPFDIVKEVRVTQGYSRFHLLRYRHGYDSLGKVSLCGLLESHDLKGNFDDYDLNQIPDLDGQICKHCLKTVNKRISDELKFCSLCSRTNIMEDCTIKEVDIRHGESDSQTEDICGKCIESVSELEKE